MPSCDIFINTIDLSHHHVAIQPAPNGIIYEEENGEICSICLEGFKIKWAPGMKSKESEDKENENVETRKKDDPSIMNDTKTEPDQQTHGTCPKDRYMSIQFLYVNVKDSYMSTRPTRVYGIA